MEEVRNTNKISIIGGPGTGKSTLAKNLGKELNLPICHIDAIHHLKNWEIRDKKERDKIILEKIKEQKWIIDGTYKDTLNQRIKASDLIIFLDYSTLAKLKGVLSRYFKYRGKEIPEIPGCIEKVNLYIIKCALKWNKTKRCNVVKELENNKNKKIIIFNNRKQLNKWYEKEFGKKIKKYFK